MMHLGSSGTDHVHRDMEIGPVAEAIKGFQENMSKDYTAIKT